jgi:hypothetical protein
MKKTLLKTLAIISLSLGLTLSASAVLIDLTTHAPQPADNGQATIEGWAATTVANYNIAVDPDLPAPGLQAFRVNSIPESGSTPPAAYSSYPTFGDVDCLTLPVGDFTYLALHWGGTGGGHHQLFYIGDLTGSLEFCNLQGKNGLSWYSYFGPRGVPDSGSTLILLGAALFGLMLFRRRSA